MMTRINSLVMLGAMAGLALWCCLSSPFSFAAAFVAPAHHVSPPSWSSFQYDSIGDFKPCSLVVMFAGKKEKKKTRPRNQGGGGFGADRAKNIVDSAPAVDMSPISTDVVARLDALYQLEDKDQTDSAKEKNEEGLNSSDTTTSVGDELDTEAATLRARYEEEYNYGQEQLAVTQKKQNNKHQLIQVSQSPLIFTIDEFIDPEACRRVQNDASGCFDLMYPETVSDKLFNGQESEMDGLLFNLASSLDHANSKGSYPDGLHMDTNNQCLNRHVTCILYLNDVPEECGGATVFPLARTLPNDPILEASHRLLNHKMSHTRQKVPLSQRNDVAADAHLLETREPRDDYSNDPTMSTAIRIQPKAGRLLVFFSRDSNGHEDPRAWHAGERIKPDECGRVTEKRILTLFKEVHYDTNSNIKEKESTSLETFLASMVDEQRTWLQAKAMLQRSILEQVGSKNDQQD